MAKYTVKRTGFDIYIVTARHQPWKGAATKQKSFRGSRDQVPAMVLEAASWVNSQRSPSGSA